VRAGGSLSLILILILIPILILPLWKCRSVVGECARRLERLSACVAERMG